MPACCGIRVWALSGVLVLRTRVCYDGEGSLRWERWEETGGMKGGLGSRVRRFAEFYQRIATSERSGVMPIKRAAAKLLAVNVKGLGMTDMGQGL